MSAARFLVVFDHFQICKMSLLLQIIAIYIKENIITKLQKLYSLSRTSRVGNKSPVLFVNPWAIYRLCAKYSLKGLICHEGNFFFTKSRQK